MGLTDNDPFSAEEIVSYLDTTSDFAFELRCVESLIQMGFTCKHGGSYTDPVTGKSRQFDIRARISPHGERYVRCAIECKNLSVFRPLVVSCVPRPADESFHSIVFSCPVGRVGHWSTPGGTRICDVIRVDPPESAYQMYGSVGKDIKQIWRVKTNRQPAGSSGFDASDRELFDKWAQAIASASDLVDLSAREGERQKGAAFTVVLPIVVVPDNTLWQASFDSTGRRDELPTLTNRCSLYVGHTCKTTNYGTTTNIILSHLEIVTLTGLGVLLRGVNSNSHDAWFSPLKMEAYRGMLGA